MDIGVSFLGISLKSPLIVGSSSLDQTVESAKACQDAGAGMLVLHSLFEEQFHAEQLDRNWSMEHGSSPEVPLDPLESEVEDVSAFALSPQEYYERLEELKKTLTIPVVGSINGLHPGNWVMYANEMQAAGADAIELNIYDPVIQGDKDAGEVEARLLEVVRLVRRSVTIPLAVKLSPFYTSFGHLARKLDGLGVDGIVLFNRFYQPDIDIASLRPFRNLRYSTPDELALRLRWTAALSGQIKANMAVTGGVHSGTDILKAILVGAHAVQVVSAIMKHGTSHITAMLTELKAALGSRGGTGGSLTALRGRLSLEHTGNRDAYERANYVQLLRDRAGAAT